MSQVAEARFRAAYAAHRAAEGRGLEEGALLTLPYLKSGPLAREWSVRARSFEVFTARVLEPLTRAVAPRRVRLLDLGAGNGWLCHRVARRGLETVALDWRYDAVDGLGTAALFSPHVERMFPRVAASFAAVPFPPATFDLAVFNAAIHYATDLWGTLAEACRVVRPGGRVAIVDSPFYRRDRDGQAMVTEKQRDAPRVFGPLAADLLAVSSIEYLTPARLAEFSRPLGLTWRRHRVRYPFWYELRPLAARLRGARAPSRFDVWEAVVP